MVSQTNPDVVLAREIDFNAAWLSGQWAVGYWPISTIRWWCTLHFNGHFPGETGLAGPSLISPSPFIQLKLHLLQPDKLWAVFLLVKGVVCCVYFCNRGWTWNFYHCRMGQL